jgi:hypothetical protein
MSFTILSISIALALSIFMFITGSAFISDLIAGAILGALVSWHFIRLDIEPLFVGEEIFTRKRAWLGLIVATVMLLAVWPFPTFLYWLVASVAMLVNCVVWRDVSASDNNKARMMSLAVITAVSALYMAIKSWLSFSGLGSIVVSMAAVFCLLVFPVSVAEHWLTKRRGGA